MTSARSSTSSAPSILGATDLSDAVAGMREEAVGGLIDQFVPHQTSPADWDLDAPQRRRCCAISTSRSIRRPGLPRTRSWRRATFRARTVQAVDAIATNAKVERFGAPMMRQIEREIVLRKLDQHWREHLAAMDYLRQGIHLRGYAQKDYRYEFKREAFELFTAMLGAREVRDRLACWPRSRCATRRRSSARRPSSASA